ncbi:hypothetical protein [Methanogenium organophilum]|uniref:CDC48 N-terminal subdomain domain-containing protein n=1 Tax=Methanogenium organophilum TaxID=2199 RepID=A0A9X9S567_METOG|nr:hypothetical protein [Methanogenium organophilum]WAI01702.1 hypothetical protein OU421_02185 [Methanogenium organophilum]
MEGIELAIQTRSFPSHGRARVHESILPFLEVKEGDAIEVEKLPLTEDEKPKKITVSIYADTMVEKGRIRMSPEDIAKIAAAEGETVNVRRKVPFTETLGKKASETGKAVQEGAGHMGETIQKGAKDVGAKIMPHKETTEHEPEPEQKAGE